MVNRRSMMRIIARRINAAADRAYRSKSRARRRLWLIQASVRSTIQRLGSTTKRCSSSRWTIVSFQVPVLAMAAAVFCPWYPASAKINLMKGKKRRVRRLRTSRAPSRSCIAAEWTTTFNSRPSVSTRICRLGR